MSKSKTIALLYHPVSLIIFLASFTGFGLWWYQWQQQSDASQASTITSSSKALALSATTSYPTPLELQDFDLISSNAEAITKQNFQGYWNLLFFGFTHCPDICPTTLQMMSSVEKKLTKIDSDHNVRFWFVSVDPQRDTPEKLNQYVNFFNPELHAATGTDAELLKLTRQLAIGYEIESHEEGNDQYSVDHSSAIILVNPQSKLHGVMTAPHRPADILSDLQKLMKLL